MPLFSKKPQVDDIEEFRDITDDVIEEDFVPYACHWDPNTIATKNGELLQIIKITGFTHQQLDHQDDEDADLRSKIRQAVLECVDSTKYAIWVHTIRRKQALQTEGEFKRDFAGYLNRFWNDKNDWENQFTNEVYITIVHEGEGAELLNPKNFARGILPFIDMRRREVYMDEKREELNVVVDNMLEILDAYGAHRLAVNKRGETYYSDAASFLGKLITMMDNDFPLRDIDMSRALTEYDVTFGFNAMEVRMREGGQRRFGALLTIKEYRELPLESLDTLLQIPARFVITQCFDFVNAAYALKDYRYQRKLFTVSKATGLSDKTGLTEVIASNKGKPTDYGLHQLTIFLLSDTVRDLENSVVKAANALTQLGMTPMREDLKFEEGYWAQLPGNFEFVKRLRPINTARIGGFANLSNYPAGQKHDNHWGMAVSTFHTAAHTPYFFNFHVGDNGHTTLLGHPDSGKTLLMNFLLAQARKFDNKLFVLDRDRNSEIFLRSLSATYYNAYPRADARSYMDVTFNPLLLPDTKDNRAFLLDWLRMLVKLRPEREKIFSEATAKALDDLMKRPQAERKLSALAAIISADHEEFAEIFADWIGQGDHAAIFDNSEDTLVFNNKIFGFEMGDVVRSRPGMMPIFAYLMHRIEMDLDGTPTIIVIDEAWTFLDMPLFARPGAVEKWLGRLREKNAMLLLTSEHIEEARTSAVNRELMQSVATQIYLSDEEADDSYIEAFGLSDREIAYLSMMDKEDHHFLLKRAKDAIVCELDLTGMADIMAVLSATRAHLEVMERVIAERGIAPGQWMPKFLERI